LALEPPGRVYQRLSENKESRPVARRNGEGGVMIPPSSNFFSPRLRAGNTFKNIPVIPQAVKVANKQETAYPKPDWQKKPAKKKTRHPLRRANILCLSGSGNQGFGNHLKM
jgi:hypothetical protein